MALAIGNKTNDLNNPGASTTRTFAHTQNVGADGYLFVVTSITNSSGAPTGVTYNGVSMTLLESRTTTTTQMAVRVWGLANPATGSNNVVITWAASPFNPCSTECISFTGSSGFGNSGFTDTSGPPNTTATVTVSTNSVIVACGWAGLPGLDVTIDGSSRTIDWNNNANNYSFGGVSATGLTSGSKTSSLNAVAQVAVLLIEIKEQSGASSGSRNTQAILL